MRHARGETLPRARHAELPWHPPSGGRRGGKRKMARTCLGDSASEVAVADISTKGGCQVDSTHAIYPQSGRQVDSTHAIYPQSGPWG